LDKGERRIEYVVYFKGGKEMSEKREANNEASEEKTEFDIEEILEEMDRRSQQTSRFPSEMRRDGFGKGKMLSENGRGPRRAYYEKFETTISNGQKKDNRCSWITREIQQAGRITNQELKERYLKRWGAVTGTFDGTISTLKWNGLIFDSFDTNPDSLRTFIWANKSASFYR